MASTSINRTYTQETILVRADSFSRYFMKSLSARVLCGPILVCLCFFALQGNSDIAFAESPAPTIHWGGLGYPDQVNTLSIGYTGNRFTEFNGNGDKYNKIDETMGLNFGSISWTQHWTKLPGLSTNITVGAGPTGEQPTRYLQNEFIHNAIYS